METIIISSYSWSPRYYSRNFVLTATRHKFQWSIMEVLWLGIKRKLRSPNKTNSTTQLTSSTLNAFSPNGFYIREFQLMARFLGRNTRRNSASIHRWQERFHLFPTFEIHFFFVFEFPRVYREQLIFNTDFITPNDPWQTRYLFIVFNYW